MTPAELPLPYVYTATVVSLALKQRDDNSIKTKQPLSYTEFLSTEQISN